MSRWARQAFIILDDDPLTVNFHRNILKKVGVKECVTYLNAMELLDSIKTHNYRDTILLCDLRMPSMDGVEFIRKLAQNNFLGQILIISGVDNKLMESVIVLARALDLNILGGLPKPLKPSMLVNMLNKKNYQAPKTILTEACNLTKDELVSALKNDEIFLMFQPKVELNGLTLVGAEVLSRWQHPKYGIISPLVFIDFSERENLVTEVTFHVLRLAFKQIAQWKKQDFYIPISVNVSEYDLQRLELPDYLASLSKEYQIDLAMLTLEVTESCLMSDLSKSLDVLSRVRLRNIGLSIDDYGTGYSTMDKLRHLPFTEIKLDQSFIKNIDHDKEDYMIIKANIEMAKNLGLQCVAEGIERKEELEVLKKLNCDIGQGYYFSQPLVADAFATWVKTFES